jgi:hypothetical protein
MQGGRGGRKDMWELLLEWCADFFGVTARGRLAHLAIGCAALFAIGIFIAVRWGALTWLATVALLTIAVTSAREVTRAREAVFRAACLPIDAPGQAPDVHAAQRHLPATAIALHRLAAAVNDARRGNYVDAETRVPTIERHLLRPAETHLLEAARAMISLGLGDTARAAQQAVVALPTGSEDLDATLARALLTDAWGSPPRLRAIARAWQEAPRPKGLGAGTLTRLARLTRVRIDPRALDEMSAAEVRDLVPEARAVGDDELAAELAARANPTPYR